MGSESEVQSPLSVARNSSSSKKTIDYNSAGMWKQYSAMIKTSAVVTLSLCKLIGDLLLASGEVFQVGHLEQLLTALEVQYWHTLLFHGNVDLLTRLAEKGFVVILPGPHLIDQEVQSARIILRTIIDIYLTSNSKHTADSTSGPGADLDSGVELDAFVAPWISRSAVVAVALLIMLSLFPSHRSIPLNKSIFTLILKSHAYLLQHLTRTLIQLHLQNGSVDLHEISPAGEGEGCSGRQCGGFKCRVASTQRLQASGPTASQGYPRLLSLSVQQQCGVVGAPPLPADSL